MTDISKTTIRNTIVLVDSLSQGISNEERINKTLDLLKKAIPMTDEEVEEVKECITNMLSNFQ